jgi:cytochrome c oxidase subunit III
MSAVTKPRTHDESHPHGHELTFAEQLHNNRLGIWLFCVSELFMFGALLVARFSLWGMTRPELDQTVGLIATSVLLVSSFFIFRAETAIAHGDRKTFLNSMLMTAFLGTLFLIGVVGFEWGLFGIEIGGHAPLSLSGDVYGAVFYAMTGIHALHVLTGVILILIVWNNGRRGHFTPERHWGVEAAAIYWHYVDVIWVLFYPALYLIGTAVH